MSSVKSNIRDIGMCTLASFAPLSLHNNYEFPPPPPPLFSSITRIFRILMGAQNL